ncbi:MAG: hypothetical protein WC346_10925 [Methanogenium sp.]|jgi:hypothetical protein
MKHNRIKYKFNKDKIDIDNPIFCYFIGLVSTDGYISVKTKRVIIRIRNEDSFRLLTKLKEYFEYEGPIFKYKDKDYELRLSSMYLIKYLENLNITKDKTTTLPFISSFSTEDCFRMYIRGLHDGDGNIKRRISKISNRWIGGEFRILNNNKQFIIDFCNWFNKKFYTNYIPKIAKRKYTDYLEFYSGVKKGKDFAKWFYQGFDEIKLFCKYKKYLTVRDNDIVRTIENKKSIEL